MKNTKSRVKPQKMSKEERERIDNMVVLATSIGLVGAIALLYLYRWLNSSYVVGTRRFIDVLTWICDAGIAAAVVLFFVKKKDKKYLSCIPYFAGTALLLAFLAHYNVFANVLHLSGILTQKVAVIIIYICIVIYLVSTYVYFGLKIRKASGK